MLFNIAGVTREGNFQGVQDEIGQPWRRDPRGRGTAGVETREGWESATALVQSCGCLCLGAAHAAVSAKAVTRPAIKHIIHRRVSLSTKCWPASLCACIHILVGHLKP